MRVAALIAGMSQYLWIGLGSALGGMARHAVSAAIVARYGASFPYGTLLVNVTGALLIGFVSARAVSPAAIQFWMIGILGGYTTFSAFSLQTVELMKDSRWTAASVYILSSVALCLVGVNFGQTLAKTLR